MKEDISRYVGIKHYFGESSFEKCDCFGLVKLFYREHGWPQTFTDDNPEPVTEANYAQPRMWRRLYKYMLTHFERVDYADLQFGDVVIMQVNLCMHMGIYVGYGKVLGMEIPTVYGQSESTLYTRPWWTRVFKYAFRRKP